MSDIAKVLRQARKAISFLYNHTTLCDPQTLRDLMTGLEDVAALASALQAEPVAWKNVEDGLPEDGELVLCEFEEDALTKRGFEIHDGYMLERWSTDKPVAGVIRWISVNKIPETLAELESLNALKYLATGGSAQ